MSALSMPPRRVTRPRLATGDSGSPGAHARPRASDHCTISVTSPSRSWDQSFSTREPCIHGRHRSSNDHASLSLGKPDRAGSSCLLGRTGPGIAVIAHRATGSSRSRSPPLRGVADLTSLRWACEAHVDLELFHGLSPFWTQRWGGVASRSGVHVRRRPIHDLRGRDGVRGRADARLGSICYNAPVRSDRDCSARSRGVVRRSSLGAERRRRPR